MRLIVGILAAASLAFSQPGGRAPHALAPLSADEIRQAVRIFRESGWFPARARFSMLSLQEAPKEAVLRGQGVARQAFAVVYDYRANQTFEGIADLGGGRVVSWREI